MLDYTDCYNTVNLDKYFFQSNAFKFVHVKQKLRFTKFIW